MPDEAFASFLELLQAADEHGQVSAHSHCIGEIGDLTLDRCQVYVNRGTWIQPVRFEQLAHRDDHLVGQARRQDLADAFHHSVIDGLYADAKIVSADLAASVEVRRAGVEPGADTIARTAALLRADVQAAVAAAAARKTRQQVPRFLCLRPADGGTNVLSRRRNPPVSRQPECLVHDAQLRRVHSEPIAFRSIGPFLLPPAIPLSCSVPDDRATIQLTKEDFVYGGMGPRCRSILLRTRRRCRLFVEQLRDPLLPYAGGSELEDASHNRGLAVVDAPLGVRRLTDVVVPERAAPGHVAGARELLRFVCRPLTGQGAMHFVDALEHREQQLVRRVVDGAFPVLEIKEHAHAGFQQPLERVAGFPRFAAET